MSQKVPKEKDKLITPEAEQFLARYINNPSPTGFEAEGQKLWLNYIKPYIDDHYVDNYGTVFGIVNPGKDFKVVIEAHADEISWFVSYITDDGFIYVKRNGGSDHQIAPSKRVNIHTKNGVVKAVFGWPAIHLRKPDKEEPPTMKNIFLDCGCRSKKEVAKMGVQVGDVITYEDEFIVFNKRYYLGRALDNRIGGFMISQVARLLKESGKKLPYSLYIVNAVQEEVGLRGAEMIVETIKPNVAIITDVCHDTTIPGVDKKVEGDFACGRGPVVTVAPAVHNKLLKLITDVAEKSKVNLQRDAASRVTGTDTDAFAYANGGVPSVLISLALRYMHTTVEAVDIEDTRNVIKLIYETLLKLKPNFNFKYL